MLAKKLKRTLALLLSTIMILGLLPVSAFAAFDNTRQQIVNTGGTNYYSNTGEPQQKKDDSTAVEVTKEVSPHKDGAENHFTIDLSVTTNQHVEEIHYSEDSAVVLVLDVSGSMNACAECGKAKGFWDSYYSHASDCKHYNRLKPSVTFEQSRMAAAKSAALQFLNSYHESGSSKDGTIVAQRQISIMLYSTEAWRVVEWTDVTDPSNYVAVKGVLEGLGKPNGDTNIEGGLLLARNNLRTLGDSFKSQYVVLLTDGEPTNHVRGNQDKDLATQLEQLNGEGIGGDDDGWAIKAAERVKGTSGTVRSNATLYTIAFGNESDSDWLRDHIASSAQTALTAGNTAELEAAFTIISNNIETWAEAWVVTDPMGANIAFDTATGEDGTLPNMAAKFDAETKTLSWDLKSAKPTGVSGDGSSFTYTLSYDIVLDTTGLGGSKAACPTNKDTTLTYVMVNAQGIPTTDPSKPYIATFQLPTVKGEAGKFLFKKVSQETYGQEKKANKPLPGAEFTLTHGKDCPCGLTTPAQTTWTVTSNEGGVVNFEDVPSGHTYVLKETAAPEGYAADGTEYQVAVVRADVQVDGEHWASDEKLVYNTLDPKAVPVTVTKTWQDSAAPGQRPEAGGFTVTLTGNDAGESTYTITDWTERGAVWTGTAEVPTVDVTNGQPISYTITESDLGGYALTGGSSKNVVWAMEDGTIVSGSAALTNTLQATVPVKVTKVWLAPEGMIPDSLDVTLSAGDKSYDLTLTGPAWTNTVDVDLYANGNKLTYTVSEDTTGLTGFEDPLYQGSQETGFTILNAVEQKYLTISGDKTWVGEKPEEAQEITLTGNNGYTDTVELTNGNTSFQFTDVPKYDIQAVKDSDGKITGYEGTGKEIVYTVSDEVDGFTQAQAGVTITGSTGTAALKNVRDDISDTITVTAQKVWVDEDNASSTRPAEAISVALQRLEDGDWTTVETGAFTPETDDEGIVTWTDAVFSAVPKFDSETGVAYQYQVKEAEVTNYETTYADPVAAEDGSLTFTVTNTLDSGEDGATTSVTVTKVWKDPYTDDTRPAEAVITLTGDNGYSDTWTTNKSEQHTFPDLPLYADGKKVVYTATEKTLPGYTSARSTDGFTFTNTIEQVKRDITVAKIWEDAFADPASRPNIEITLYRGGSKDDVVASVSGGEMTKVTDNKYTYTFEGLDTYHPDTGKAITYNVLESVTGNNAERFTSSVAGNMAEGFTVTNTFQAGTTTVSGDKVWVRPEAVALPDSVTIAVYGADKENPADIQAISPNGDGSWKYSFTDLPMYDAADGSLIDYTVAELDVPDGWTASVSTEDKRTITNTSDVLDDTIQYTVTKTWVGPESDRPDTLGIVVFQSDGQTPAGICDLTAAEGWTHTFTLPKYEGTKLATYSAKEADSYYFGGGDQLVVQGRELIYKVTSTSTEYGTAFTNTVLQDNTVTVDGEKFWAGAPVAFTAPEITVELWADSVKIGAQTVGETAEDGTRDWTFFFGNLPKYALDSDGHEIVYSVKEQGAANGTALFVQDNKEYYFSVTGGTEIAEGGRAGYYDLTNEHSRTDVYSYKVMGEYTVNIDGKPVGNVRTELEPVKNAGAGANISRSPEDASKHIAPVFPEGSVLAAYSGKTFTYNEKGSKPSVKLEKANQVYEIVLKYTYDLTTTSYTVNHEYYVDDVKQDHLEGDTHTYSNGVYKGDEVSADSIDAQENRGGLKYTLTNRTPTSLTLGDAANNVFTFTYHYTTPPTPTYTLTVNHVDLEGNEAHKDIFQNGQPVTHEVTETVTASPLNADTGLPAGYKLVKTSDPVDDKITFDETGVASVRGSANDELAVTYYYGPEDTVLITINYLRNDEDRTPIAELPKQELTGYRSYDPYDVTQFIYQPTAGEHGQYTYVTDSTKTESTPDGVYAGTLGTQDLVIDVLYDVGSYPYKVVFHNDYTNTVLATVSSANMMAEYGTALTSEDLRVWFPDAQDWVNAYRPSGYNAGTVTYPASIGYSPTGVFTEDPAGGDPVWDHSPITNIVHVHYGYSSSSGNDDRDPSYRITVNYLEEESGEVLAPRYRTGYLTRGSSYDVTEWTTDKVIDGYDFVRTEGAKITGRITGNLTIDVYYTPVVHIPDNPIPEGGQPDEPVTPPPADGGEIPGGEDVDIPDGGVPLGDGGGISDLDGGSDTGTDIGTGLDDGGTIIVDDRIPMGNLPQTGTLSTPVDPTATLAYLTLAASMAAAGLAFATGRRKEEDEE